MGLAYTYLNIDKKQYFMTGLNTGSSRMRDVGFGAGGRALSLLLRNYWRGDRIQIEEENLSDPELVGPETFVEITYDVELFLIEHDGIESIIDKIHFDTKSSNFKRLGHYAVLLENETVTKFLDSHFGGKQWRKDYQRAAANEFHFVIDHIMGVKERALNFEG